MTGRSARASSAAAASTASRSPRRRGATRDGSSRSTSPTAVKMPPGTDTSAGILEAEGGAHLVSDRERVHQRQLGGAGVAEHDIDALLLQQREEGALSGHDGQEVLQSGLGEAGGAQSVARMKRSVIRDAAG